MSSESTSDLGFDALDRDDYPDGSIDVIGAVRNINTAGETSHATRAEVARLFNDETRDYQWARYRLDALRDGDVLDQNDVHIPEKSTVEHRYTVTDDYIGDARSIARTLSLTDGEIPQDVGVDEFTAVIGSLGDALERIDNLEDRVDALEGGDDLDDGDDSPADDDGSEEDVGIPPGETPRSVDGDPYTLTDIS